MILAVPLAQWYLCMSECAAYRLIAAGHGSIPGWVGSFLFQNAIPFSVVLSGQKLSGQLLDDVYESIQESVLPVLAAPVKYGSTVASDGWSDVNRRLNLNFMNVTRGRAVLSKSMDCTDHMAEGGRKGAAYIASQIISTIEEFSP